MAANLLFAVLAEHERRRIAPYCETVALHVRATLCRPDEPIDYAHFPESGVCSALIHAENGDAVEVGLACRRNASRGIYANLYPATVAQTAVCNRVHRIERRLARWLLEMHDRAGGDVLPMTHEILGLMAGAYRPSITSALKALADRNLVRVSRGRVTIVDADALEREACECRRAIRRRTAATLAQIRRLAA